MKPTPEQQKIIDAKVGDILVSAAAGSGKTAVLTDRIVRRIAAGHTDIRHVLVMTFTDKAAKEMKSRIEAKLRDALAQTKDASQRRDVSRQLSWLTGASISTIHSFCLSVIRDFGYCLHDANGEPLLDAGFRVDDGIESELLLRDALAELMQDRYEAIDKASLTDRPNWCADFYHLLDGYGLSRSDQPVLDLILDQFGYLRSLPHYRKFAETKLAELRQAVGDFSQSRHAKTLFDMLRLRLDRALMVLPQLEERLDQRPQFIKDEARNQAYLQLFLETFACLRQIDQQLRGGKPNWDTIHQLGQSLQPLALPRRNARDSEAKTEFLDLFDQQVAEVVHHLSGACHTKKFKDYFVFDTQPVFTVPTAAISRDLSRMLPVIELFYQLLFELDERYWQKKREKGFIDFSDFEHLALQLLQKPEVQSYYRTRYREVFIDEYQDTSSIQEAVVAAIADQNCLMVGDLKQSIYRFRHARPQIFKDKAGRFQSDPNQGQLIELSRNFRSVRSILTGVNELFDQLMSRDAGEIDYDRSQALVPHQEDEKNSQPVCLHLLDLAQSETKETLEPELQDYKRHEKEACLAAIKMRCLREKGHAWQEIAVLCRTKNLIQTAAEALLRQGIPVLEGSDTGSFDLPELRLIESFIHLLDNACQDIPLAAIMRSQLPPESFTETELSCLRLHSQEAGEPRSYFYAAAARYGQSGKDPTLRRKTAHFFSWLEQWRQRAIDMRLDEFLAEFFSQTYWFEALAARPDGARKIKVLQQFQALASEFEGPLRRGVHPFARHLENLREREALAPFFPQASDREDGVRIMTVHGSKGLEFPIVFLIGSSYKIRPKDRNDAILISESLGIGMDYVDPALRVRYPSHLKLAMFEEVKAAGMAEELRLLYVALTRAEKQLHVVASLDLNQEKKQTRLAVLLHQVRQIRQRKLPSHLVLAATCYLDWLLLALARSPTGSSLCESILAGDDALSPPARTFESVFSLHVSSWPQLAASLATAQDPSQPPVREVAVSEAEPAAKPTFPGAGKNAFSTALAAAINQPYPFLRATRTPAKLAVSELKRQEQQLARREEASEEGFSASALAKQEVPDIKDPRGINLSLQILDLNLASPGASNAPEDAAGLGTLLHQVLRYLDLPAARRGPSQETVLAQLAAMRQQGIFSLEDLSRLRPWQDRLAQFVDSDLAAEMVAVMQSNRDTIYVEIPFTLAVPTQQLYPGSAGFAPGDHGMVQGIIDCWFEKEGKITLVDYKSDRIEGDDETCARILHERYAGQLNWYAKAIAAVRERPVHRCLIWHIPRGKAFAMPVSID